jgi:hypothetical protein
MTVTNLIILLNGIVVGMLVYKTDRLRHEVNNLAKADLQMIEVLKQVVSRRGKFDAANNVNIYPGPMSESEAKQ